MDDQTFGAIATLAYRGLADEFPYNDRAKLVSILRSAGWMAPDSAARLREFFHANVAYDSSDVGDDEAFDRYIRAYVAITEADLGITTDSNAWDMRDHPDSPNDLIVSPEEADAMGLNDIRGISMVVHDGLHIVLHFSREEHRVISRLSQASSKTPWDWARDLVVAAMEETR